MHYLCTAFRAQMAESVDALVSNTSGVTPVPVRPRLWVLLKKRKVLNLNMIRHLVLFLLEYCWKILFSFHEKLILFEIHNLTD